MDDTTILETPNSVGIMKIMGTQAREMRNRSGVVGPEPTIQSHYPVQ